VAKVNLSQFNKQMAALETLAADLPAAVHAEFVKNTPIDKGNARRSTRLQNNTIIADYPYSQSLEDGHSRQAPRGMVEPTEQWIQKEVNRRLKGTTNGK
jgi:hypothetical protein